MPLNHVVWKYKLTKMIARIKVPNGAKFLKLGVIDGEPVLWFQVNPKKPAQEKIIRIVPTGVNFSALTVREYLGTFDDNGFVGHVYEINGGEEFESSNYKKE